MTEVLNFESLAVYLFKAINTATDGQTDSRTNGETDRRTDGGTDITDKQIRFAVTKAYANTNTNKADRS